MAVDIVYLRNIVAPSLVLLRRSFVTYTTPTLIRFIISVIGRLVYVLKEFRYYIFFGNVYHINQIA